MLLLHLHATLVSISFPYFYFFFHFFSLLIPYLFVFLLCPPRTNLFLSPLKYHRGGFISCKCNIRPRKRNQKLADSRVVNHSRCSSPVNITLVKSNWKNLYSSCIIP